MQLLSIKNIFEYQDKKLDGVKENLFKNINQLQGLGVPDICIITKQQPINIIKSSYETSSSFHFVQGLCPQSQADVFAYLESVVQNQEKERQNIFFSKVQSITKVNGAYIKVTYLCYDIFSKAFLVCEASFEGQKNKSVFLVQENQRMIQPTQQHWNGAYISNILRAIDEDFKLVGVGRFFNNLCLKNNTKLCKMIESMLELITINVNQFQDFDKIRSNQCFCDINDVLYYLCWPLDILVSHLVKSHQLFILVKELDKIQSNVIFHLIKSMIFYKMKQSQMQIRQYQRSLSCIGNITQKVQQFNLVKYILGKVLIKLGKYQQAFQILQDTLTNSYENQVVWIALVKRAKLILGIHIQKIKQLSGFSEPIKQSSRPLRNEDEKINVVRDSSHKLPSDDSISFINQSK
ncbi:unnamed protein product (macronuclear) [Paramecium tetraurelia]|uniref:Tetratricopeptide repeat protein n=1 Tax=Paramecium tetraurelia TaxID=5888 RepID=A0EFF4_PARTE|nr:uncharacterized protein GSPATT00026368001 [Paramecium tetraurelia]CAK94045.1 unnamed protein product [Paramecium tetraurelia]|eukprot:XP_001461418.1 hypothetical protein (macronuclear) [Paramecium tetraurelia strain d4-2]